MKLPIAFTLMVGLPGWLGAAPAAPRQDLLRFANGDQLHGSFQGIKDGLLTVWQREDLAVPSEFKSTLIHKIVLRGARPSVSNEALSHVALVTGDRIPGALTALDDESVTVSSTLAGVLRIPRGLVAMIAPAPMGGNVTYHGPYSEDGWLMVNAEFPNGIPPLDPAAAKALEKLKPPAKDPDDQADEEEEDAEVKLADEETEAGDKPKESDPNKIPRWNFSGAAWYWSNKQANTALVRKTGMAERSALRFNLAWRSRLMLSVAFHADFAQPAAAEPKEGEEKDEQAKRQFLNRGGQGDPTLPKLFGNCYVLQINSGYAILMRCGYDEKGNPSVERLQMNNPTIRLSETGAASFELRCDRTKGTISLHVDGAAAMEWTEPAATDEEGYAGKGSGFGFMTQMENSMVRVSDVVVADWNGMPDSARSLQSDDQDIVLLTNGTDRFSGKITGFQDGKLRLHGKFGDFILPLSDVAEARFARNSHTKPADPAAESITVRIDPIGNLTGKPISGDTKRLRMETLFAGQIDINLDSAIMLDFETSNNYLDDWDQPF
jgi:hypothetical protein